jgi:hypothetical protein
MQYRPYKTILFSSLLACLVVPGMPSCDCSDSGGSRQDADAGEGERDGVQESEQLEGLEFEESETMDQLEALEMADQPEEIETPAECSKKGDERSISRSAGDSFFSSLAWTGSEYGVVWIELVDQPLETGLYFARIDTSGNRVGDIVQLSDAFPSILNFPSLAWSGSEYAAAWVVEGSISFLRFNASGDPIGEDVLIANDSSGSEAPDIVWADGGYAAVWADDRDGNGEIYFARIDAAGTQIGSDIRLTDDPSDSTFPSLAWTGSEYAAAWIDAREGNEEVFFARMDASGNKLGDDVRVTQDSTDSKCASLAWTGSEFGVLWYELGDALSVYFTSLSSSGAVAAEKTQVSHAEIAGRNFQREVDLVWNGSRFGAAWSDFSETGVLFDSEMYFAALDPSGSPSGGKTRVTNDPDRPPFPSDISKYPSLVWGPGEFAISWDDARNSETAKGEIFFIQVECD